MRQKPNTNMQPQSIVNGIRVLTRRELQVASLIVKEYSYKMIADKLNISVRTVEAHARNIHTKTGKHNVAGVINLMNGSTEKN